MMPERNTSLWDTLQAWTARSANRAAPLPRAQTDLPAAEQAVRADGGYLRLQVGDMRVAGAGVCAVFGAVRLRVGDAEATLYRVARAPAERDGFSLRGYLLSDWLPYRGGEVQAAIAVVALPSAASGALDAIEQLSARVRKPLAQATGASEAVERSARALLGDAEPAVLLAWSQALAANGRVGPAYVAVRASEAPGALSAREGRLLTDGQLPGGDFLLARIETTPSRDDSPMPDVERPLRAALEAFLRRDYAVNAPGLAAEALEKIIKSPDLSGADRHRIAIAAAETLGAAASAPHGAAGDAVPTLADIVGRAQPASAMLNKPMPVLRQLMERVVPMEAMVLDEAPPPTGAIPEETGKAPETFEAYPRLDAPDRVDPEQEFPLTVGFRAERDATLAAGGGLMEVTPVQGENMLVTITSFDVEVLGEDIAELPLDVGATHVFRCKPNPGVENARVRATYFYARQCVGFAEREIRVGAPEQMRARAMPSASPSLCRMPMPPPPEYAVDIEVHLSHHETAAGSRLIWEVMAAKPPIHWKLEGPALPNAAGFAARLITLMDSGATGRFALNALQTIGQDIRAKIPQALFDALGQVRDAVRSDPARAGDAPTMLWYTDTETFIPWELTLLPESEPGAPVFLGQAWRVGRWLQCEGIQQPPPVRLDVRRITAVASAYGLSTPSGLRTLPFALRERTALRTLYGAASVDATQAGVEPLCAAKAEEGHVVHFAVHGTSLPKTDTHYISLEDRSQLYPEMLVGDPYRCGSAPLFSFVFINACQVGTSGEVLGVAAGFPGRIVRSGAAGFIAPLWSVNDEFAHDLATQFYAQTLGAAPGAPEPAAEGLTVGEVLRRQRAAFDPKRGTTPMAYIYYGHPNLRLTRENAAPGGATRTAVSAAASQGGGMSNASTLDGSGVPVSLAPGYSLQAPGVVGSVREQSRTAMSTRGDSGVHEKTLYEALERHNVMGLAKLFEVQVERVDTGAPAPATRAGEPALEFRMPSDANMKAMVLYTDENGISTWVRPEPGTGPSAGAGQAGTRGGEGDLVFRLPRGTTWQPPAAGAPGTRGPIGVIGRRVIRALYWATDELLGKPIAAIAEQIEKPVHPYRFHRVTPETYQQQDQSGLAVDWDELQKGRALLLLHGTFSSAEATYWSFPRETVERWHAHYGGRVFAFNHPTVYHSPQDNIDRFLEMMPPNTSLDLDVITHSRGGLVGRELAERLAAHQPAAQNRSVQVHNVILFASPNAGTALVDVDRETDLVDTYTNFLTGLPDNAVTLLLEGILAAVKILGHAALTQLPGLASFRPAGPYLTALNAAPQFTATYHAVTSDYSPEAPALSDWLQSLAARARIEGRDALLDAFFGEANDAVVPTRGSYEVLAPDGASRLAIPEDRRLVLQQSQHIWHCAYFGHPRVNEKVREWLGVA